MRVLPEGRAARARLAALRDAHRGETCVILGNGPSMRGFDLARLDGTPTFCLNRGYLLWEDSDREPSFFVAVNDLVIDQFHREIAALPCPLFLPWIYRDRFRGVPNAVFFEIRNDQRFITDARRGVAPCATVTVAALQLAYHMGFCDRDPARDRPPLRDRRASRMHESVSRATTRTTFAATTSATGRPGTFRTFASPSAATRWPERRSKPTVARSSTERRAAPSTCSNDVSWGAQRATFDLIRVLHARRTQWPAARRDR